MAGGNEEKQQKQPAAAAGKADPVSAGVANADRYAERMREAIRIQVLINQVDNALREAQAHIDESRNEAAKRWLLGKKK